MGRPRKRPRYLMVYGNDLASASKGGEFKPSADEDVPENLMDVLQCPVADEVLIALRKSYSLTFPFNHLMKGLQASLAEIRRVSTEALIPLKDVLAELGLPPVPTTMNDRSNTKVYLFTYALVRSDDLKVSVRFKGKTRSLLRIIQHHPADDLIKTLRAVLSDTFSEAYDEEQHTEILTRIRQRIADVLPSYNQQLYEIGVELIEVPEFRDEPAAES